MNTDIELNVEALEAEINRMLAQMSELRCDSDEYAKMMDQLVKLYKAKDTHVTLKLKEVETDTKARELTSAQLARDFDMELRSSEATLSNEAKELDVEMKRRDLSRRWLPSNDALGMIAANLAGIVMIIGYERANVIATKAFGFVSKLR